MTLQLPQKKKKVFVLFCFKVEEEKKVEEEIETEKEVSPYTYVSQSLHCLP